LRLVTELLSDPEYVARLERHYYLVKGAATDPNHAVQQVRAAPLGGPPWRAPVNRTKSKRKRRK
jgi:hypothetical protein